MNNKGCWQTLTVLSCVFMIATATAPAFGQNIEQLTDDNVDLTASMAIVEDGAFVYAVSSTNQLGGNPDHRYQVFKFDTATGAATQITTLPYGVVPIQVDFTAGFTMDVTDDGLTLAFVSNSDPFGTNPDHGPELFTMMTSGAGLTQLTTDNESNGGSIGRISFAGSGNRIVFVSNCDYLGTNPSKLNNVFIINSNGTGLAQLTTAPDGRYAGLSISDDGTRVAFSHEADWGDFDGDGSTDNPDFSFEVFKVNWDGTGLKQVTNGDGFGSFVPEVSGDGSSIVYESTDNPVGMNNKNQNEIFIIDWDGSNQDIVTTTQSNISNVIPQSSGPTISDDGEFIFFTSNHSQSQINTDGNFEIFRAEKNGSNLTQVTDTQFSDGAAGPEVSGDGSVVAFYSPHDFDGSSNIDLSLELFATDRDGSSVTQLSEGTYGERHPPDMSENGAKIVFSSTLDPFGTDPDRGGELYIMNQDGTGLTQLTTFVTGSANRPTISADGTKIAFVTDADVDGSNVDASEELHVINADGSGLTRLTSLDRQIVTPQISPDGTRVFFSSTSDVGVSNADESLELYGISYDGSGGLVQLTDESDPAAKNVWPRIDGMSNQVVFQSNGDLDLDGSTGTFEIWRIKPDGTNLTKIFGSAGQVSAAPDISSDGSTIIFHSRADPLATNPENNVELYAYDVPTSTVSQLTFTTSGQTTDGNLSPDGTWAYFSTNSEMFETDPDKPFHVGRVNVSTTQVERIGGLVGGIPEPPIPNTNGSISIYLQTGNPILQNWDLGGEIFRVQHTVPVEEITVSGGAPTTISWPWVNGALRYDVARGNVANLAQGVGVIDLGAVLCIENDSPNIDTVGFEDVADPLAGEAFFYLWRPTQGKNVGPGSYGTSSGGDERTATSGDCTN